MQKLSITPCDAIELSQQVEYLNETPVKGIADLLSQGVLQLGVTFISDIDELGNLKTEFGEIGPLKPQSKCGENKFLVSEICSILRNNPTVDDGGLLQSIESIKIAESNGEIEFNVTALFHNDEPIIKDGNKRTIAFYENRRNKHQMNINFKIFVAWHEG